MPFSQKVLRKNFLLLITLKSAHTKFFFAVFGKTRKLLENPDTD
jgi:hypothetical protein